MRPLILEVESASTAKFSPEPARHWWERYVVARDILLAEVGALGDDLGTKYGIDRAAVGDRAGHEPKVLNAVVALHRDARRRGRRSHLSGAYTSRKLRAVG